MTQLDKDTTCRNCRFFAYPECHRHAPIATVPANESYTGLNFRAWPQVTYSDWCGDFEWSDEKTKWLAAVRALPEAY